MAVGSTCMFVGPDMLENYGTIEEASQVCESSNADSHLAYIKSKEEFNPIPDDGWVGVFYLVRTPLIYKYLSLHCWKIRHWSMIHG